MRNHLVVFILTALSGSIATAQDSKSWDDFRLGKFYDLKHVEDDGVQKAAEAVIRFPTATGFLISPDGYVLTNHHVYRSFGEGGIVYRKWLKTSYAERFRISLVLKSAKYDVALYKIHGARNLPYLPIRRGSTVGEPVCILGHPKGKPLQASFGKILAKDIRINGKASIEYSAQTWWGSSGSPVLDRKGRVVAIHWGWDSKGVSNGRLTGVPFEKICRAIPKFAEIAGATRSVPSSRQEDRSAIRYQIETTLIKAGSSKNGEGRTLNTLRVEITANGRALRGIKSVTYHLHKSFRNPVIQGDVSRPGFPLQLRAWGHFKTRAVLEFEDGSKRTIHGKISW